MEAGKCSRKYPCNFNSVKIALESTANFSKKQSKWLISKKKKKQFDAITDT